MSADSPISLKPRSAFSLIEMAVAMMILAVAATVALPRLAETVAGSRGVTAAKIIQFDLELARRTAINEGRVVTVRFDWENSTYESDDVLIRVGQTLGNNLAETVGTGIELTSDFDGLRGIQFDHCGSPSTIDLLGNVQSTGNVKVSFDGEVLNVQIRPGLSLIQFGQVE